MGSMRTSKQESLRRTRGLVASSGEWPLHLRGHRSALKVSGSCIAFMSSIALTSSNLKPVAEDISPAVIVLSDREKLRGGIGTGCVGPSLPSKRRGVLRGDAVRRGDAVTRGDAVRGERAELSE